MKLGQLVQSTFNVRDEYPEELTGELAKSIKLEGLFSKLVLRPVAGDKYEVLAGWRRRLALVEVFGLDGELPKNSYVLKDVSDFEAVRVSIAENVQRVNLSTMELAGAVESLVKVDPNIKVKAMAQILWVSEARVKRLLKLTDRLPELPNAAVEELRTPEELEPTFTDAHVDAMSKAGAFDMDSSTVADVCSMIMNNELPASKVGAVVKRLTIDESSSSDTGDTKASEKKEEDPMQDRINGRVMYDDNGFLLVKGKAGELNPLDLAYYEEFVKDKEKFAVYLNAKIDIKTIGE